MVFQTSSRFPLMIATSVALTSCGASDVESRFGESRWAADDSALSDVLSKTPDFGGTSFDLSLNKLDDTTLWALANCSCQPALLDEYLAGIAVSAGVLPEALVPEIREGIRSDPRISALDSLSSGLGTLLVGLFGANTLIGNEVRNKIATKISLATQNGSKISELKFRFSPFPSPASFVGVDSAKHPTRTLDIEKQTHRWFLVFNTPNLWEGNTPASSDDHGIQVLATALVLTEWKYLFGLDHSASGESYGGLTISSEHPTTLAAFDPRKTPDAERFVAGVYKVSYPDASLLDLATTAKETWTRADKPIGLNEQSKLWLAAAAAHRRLRPKARMLVKPMFNGTPPLITDDAHRLSFTFLVGMRALLDGFFIDQDTRCIHDSAAISHSTPADASIIALARLARSLAAWNTELDDLSDAGVDATVRRKLAASPKQLKRAGQLAVQKILSGYVRPRDSQGVMLSTKTSGPSPPNLSVASETILSLILVEKTHLASPYLAHQIHSLMEWMKSAYVLPLWQGDLSGVSTADVLWLNGLLTVYAHSYNKEAPPWVTEALQGLLPILGRSKAVQPQ